MDVAGKNHAKAIFRLAKTKPDVSYDATAVSSIFLCLSTSMTICDRLYRIEKHGGYAWARCKCPGCANTHRVYSSMISLVGMPEASTFELSQVASASPMDALNSRFFMVCLEK